MAMTPRPLGPLVWVLHRLLSRDAADAAIGDIVEDLAAREAERRGPQWPRLWINLQVVRAVALEIFDGAPRRLRMAGVACRDAMRAIRSAPGHALFVTAVLALGITLATVTYSVVDAVMLKALPFDHPEELVEIPTWDFTARTARITPELFWQFHDRAQSVETLAAITTWYGSSVTVDGVTDEWPVNNVSADIFRVLRVTPVIGRLWTADDEVRGNTNVAVLGYRFWREQLGGDPDILGKTVLAGTGTFTVIGVLSAESDHAEIELLAAPVWIPRVVPRTSTSPWMSGLIARMRPGVSVNQVADEIQSLTGLRNWRPDVTPLLDLYVGSMRRWLLLALGAAALVVLAACANAANLMLTRSVARTQEMAIRASLGASRRQIAGAVLAEGLILSLTATAVALLLSVGGVRLATAAITAAHVRAFRLSAVAVNGRVLAAAIACALATGVVCALVPAWQASRVPAMTLIKDSDAPSSTGRRRWRSLFLTAEVSTVVVLLAVSWLFVASLVHALRVDLVFDQTNLIAVNSRVAFRASMEDVRRRVETVPGVSAVAISRDAPLPLIGRAFGGAWITTTIKRSDAASGASPLEVLQHRVTANYFAVAGLPFRRGHAWSADSSDESSIVLDEQAARTLFGAEDPLGRRVRTPDPDTVWTVVGTVPYVPGSGPEEPEQPSAYFPIPQRVIAGTYANLFVRTSMPAEQVLPALAAALKPVAPPQKDRFLFVATEALREITATRRFLATLMLVFGVAGLLIGAAGVYAVMASFVAQQTRELGVRVALGATPRHLQRGVLALASRHLLIGLALGVPLAWWLSRGFAALLFQVTPADASVYAGVGALLGLVGLVAAWIPARRAAKTDPIVSLRR